MVMAGPVIVPMIPAVAVPIAVALVATSIPIAVAAPGESAMPALAETHLMIAAAKSTAARVEAAPAMETATAPVKPAAAMETTTAAEPSCVRGQCEKRQSHADHRRDQCCPDFHKLTSYILSRFGGRPLRDF
jgi:hypothetical protein